ncbi:MAG: SdpI family protein [Erysipelotrichaceae bacterium]|nr:SdpI family protein [Erysipelotrichaceae bacterium]
MKRFGNEKWKVIVSTLLCLTPMFIGLALWNKLPEQMPFHFNYKGEVDQYAGKPFVVLFPGLFLAALNLLALYVTGKDPENKNVSDKIMNLIIWLVPAVSLFLSFLFYGTALGGKMSVTRTVCLLLGLMYLIFGNYSPKIRKNSTIGIRVPWTLNDEEVWNRTHRFGGFIMVIAGLILVICALLGVELDVFAQLILMIMPVTLIIGYSAFLYYRKRDIR